MNHSYLSSKGTYGTYFDGQSIFIVKKFFLTYSLRLSFGEWASAKIFVIVNDQEWRRSIQTTRLVWKVCRPNAIFLFHARFIYIEINFCKETHIYTPTTTNTRAVHISVFPTNNKRFVCIYTLNCFIVPWGNAIS